MGYYESVLRDRPFSAFRLNAAGTAYEDIGGRAQTMTGTLALGASILAGQRKSIFITGGNKMTVVTSVFKTGMHMYPFTLEAKFLPLTTTGTCGILSHSGDYDGLAFDGDFIRFGVKSLTGVKTEVVWPVPDTMEAYHVVGVYTTQKLQLYVNGEMVGETEAPDEIKTNGFATQASSGNLIVGDSPVSTEKMLVDGIAVYAIALSQSQIVDHYEQSLDIILKDQNIERLGGAYWNGDNRAPDIAREVTGDEWLVDSLITNVGAAGGELVPTVNQSTLLSNAGTWITSINVGLTQDPSLAGVTLEWDGDGGFVVETSLNNGSSWTPAVNDRLIVGSFGLNTTTAQEILVRVTFTGGVLNDPAVVRRLAYKVYTSESMYVDSSARTLTVTDNVATAADVNEPIERNAKAGVDFYGGSAIIGPDTSGDNTSIGSIEIVGVIRGTLSGPGGYIFDARPANPAYLWIPSNTLSFVGLSALYVNGVSVASGATLPRNEPIHIVAVLSTPFNNNISFGTSNLNAQYDFIGLYPATLTAAQVLELYNSYTMVPKTTINDSGLITAVEPATPWNIYDYAWDISAGG